QRRTWRARVGTAVTVVGNGYDRKEVRPQVDPEQPSERPRVRTAFRCVEKCVTRSASTGRECLSVLRIGTYQDPRFSNRSIPSSLSRSARFGSCRWHPTDAPTTRAQSLAVPKRRAAIQDRTCNAVRGRDTGSDCEHTKY